MSNEAPSGCDLSRYDAVLFDLDGVLYMGPRAIPGAPEAVAQLRQRGLAVGFVTNNASRPPEVVAARLTNLGIPAPPAQVVTSAQAAARVLAGMVPHDAPVLVVGGEGLHVALGEVGLRAVTRVSDEPAAVVQGFHPEVGWRQLTQATLALTRGLPWVLTNPDRTIPTPEGIAPGNGSLAQVLVHATGRTPDVIAGKPYPPLLLEALDRLGVCAERSLMVGDRLDTDIAGAQAVGMDSVLVLTGVNSRSDAAAAPVSERPTWIVETLGELVSPG